MPLDNSIVFPGLWRKQILFKKTTITQLPPACPFQTSGNPLLKEISVEVTY